MSLEFLPPYTPLLYTKTGIHRGILFFFIQAIECGINVLMIITENITICPMKFLIFNWLKNMVIAWESFRNAVYLSHIEHHFYFIRECVIQKGVSINLHIHTKNDAYFVPHSTVKVIWRRFKVSSKRLLRRLKLCNIVMHAKRPPPPPDTLIRKTCS